jgi:uncharacterized protein (TIGR03067 family)
MKTTLLAFLAAGLLFAADEAPNEKVKKEIDALQGTWRGVSAQDEGKALDEDTAKKMEIIIKGDKYTFKVAGEEQEQGSIKLDPAAKPKTIDLKITSGMDKGKSQAGVYELEKDTLKICLPPPGKDRPKALEGKGANSLYVFKRPKEIG